MFRIGFWADYVDNNGVFRDYWEENYYPSRTNYLCIKSFIRGITIFQTNGGPNNLIPRSVTFGKLLPYLQEEPIVSIMIAEGLSDDLTFTFQGFENYEVIPSQELGK